MSKRDVDISSAAVAAQATSLRDIDRNRDAGILEALAADRDRLAKEQDDYHKAVQKITDAESRGAEIGLGHRG